MSSTLETPSTLSVSAGTTSAPLLSFTSQDPTDPSNVTDCFIRLARGSASRHLIVLVCHSTPAFVLDSHPLKKITLVTPALKDSPASLTPAERAAATPTLQDLQTAVRSLTSSIQRGAPTPKILSAFETLVLTFSLTPARTQEPYWAPGQAPQRNTRSQNSGPTSSIDLSDFTI